MKGDAYLSFETVANSALFSGFVWMRSEAVGQAKSQERKHYIRA